MGTGGYHDSDKGCKCCCPCWDRRSKACKITTVVLLVLLVAGIVVVGSLAIHAYRNWTEDKNAKIDKNAFKCTVNCTDVDHSLWDEVLDKVLIEGVEKNGITYNAVDFQKIRDDKEVRKLHDEYLEFLQTTETDFLTPDATLAFMLNAYNAFAVDLIVNKNPGKSIRDLDDLLKGSVFDRFKYRLTIGGKNTKVSLNNVEHQIIRDKLTDRNNPLIHSSVNCVSLSCPDLRPKAFTGPKVQKQLKEQTKIWLQNEAKGLRMDKENNVIWMSKLFDWYRNDFVSTKHGGDNDLIDTKEPLEWAIQFATPEVKAFVEENDPDVKFMSYNWNLIEP